MFAKTFALKHEFSLFYSYTNLNVTSIYKIKQLALKFLSKAIILISDFSNVIEIE